MISSKYNIYNYISRGTFGNVYKCLYNNKFYAIKEEDMDKNTLKYEANIYKQLKGVNNIANLYDFFLENNKYYLVLSYYDINLVEFKIKVFDSENYINKVIKIIDILFTTITHIHTSGIIHRDLKPSNICLDSNFKPIIIDFGLSKKIINNNIHIAKKNIKNIIGSYNFISINVLNLIEPSRRDDLESIVLIYLYLILNRSQYLNYSNITIEAKRKENLIQTFINETFINETFIKFNKYICGILCMLNYIRKLKFSQEPNYNYIKNILVNS